MMSFVSKLRDKRRCFKTAIDGGKRKIALPGETAAVAPLLATQARWSRLPSRDILLIERAKSRDGHHLFVFPFEGRLVHEGLAALLAWRIANRTPSTLMLAANDWGFELSGAKRLELEARDFRQLFKPGDLLEDLFACLHQPVDQVGAYKASTARD